MRLRALLLGIVTLAATAATAQIDPIFDPDSFVDPRDRNAPLFISRLVAGGVRGFFDHDRPLRQDVGSLHLANSFYWSHFQLDYKHSEVRAENTNPPAHVQVCPCLPHIYFPSPPSDDETPDAPLQSGGDSLQFAWYHSQRGAPADPRVMLRYRLSLSRQNVDTVATFLDTDHVAARLHGHDQSIGFDADTYFRLGGHSFFGTLILARTTTSGTAADRSQNEIAYTGRFPGTHAGPVIFLATLTAGGITGRGANGLNLINPAFEASWHNWTTNANVRLIWSPLTMRDGKGWTTHHQIAITVDRALWIHLFSPPAIAVHDLH